MADEKNSNLETSPIDEELLASLNSVIFGPSPDPKDTQRWHMQGFTFSDKPEMLFGLIQANSGPCGILAPVQSFMLKYLLFDEKVEVLPSKTVCVKPTPEQRQRSLIHAIRLILSRCSDDECYKICTTPDGEAINMSDVNGKENLSSFIEKHIDSFKSPIGVLVFLYSCVASRGLEKIKNDPDDLQPLVQRFGHCSQEIVNLMLCGSAVSNVFDGNKQIGGGSSSSDSSSSSFALKGVPRKMEVGFLTVLEALRYCKVGNYYKTPQYPIWVVGSSSHYTVLFGLDPKICQVSSKEAKKQTLQTAFHQVDQDEHGFISAGDLGRVLEIVNLPFVVDEVKAKLNSDMRDSIILFEDLWSAVQKLEDEATSHLKRPEDWNCIRCTFKNKSTNEKCAICGSGAPPEPSPSDPQWSCSACGFINLPTHVICEMCNTPKPQQSTVSFDLYFFNGMEISEKAPAECHKLTVYPEGQIWNAASDEQGLREVIQTKWPNALVEFDASFGGRPKIT